MTVITDFRAIYFPYCIQKLEDGSWVILNRKYKPVGFNTSDYIEYGQYPVSAKIEDITPAILKKLSYTGKVSGDSVYLYNDGCVPTRTEKDMNSYLKKLEILAKLTVIRGN
jgi:hypothetical protein